MPSNSEVKFPSCVEEENVSRKEYPIEEISGDSLLRASEAKLSAKQGENVKASGVIKKTFGRSPVSLRNIKNRIGGRKNVSRNSDRYSTRQIRQDGQNDKLFGAAMYYSGEKIGELFLQITSATQRAETAESEWIALRQWRTAHDRT
jgi:hypothetical protein